jgi:vancomycin permeability regulator SanA
MWQRFIRQFLSFHFNWAALLKFMLTSFFLILLFLILVPFSLRKYIEQKYSAKIYTSIADVPDTKVGIVFGAGLDETATYPSGVLKDRILTAVDLYKAGKIHKLLMSGDNSPYHDETKIMINTAVLNGVSSLDIAGDHLGLRTYDSCYRAKSMYGINQAVLITQSFHLPRAMYICESLGIQVIGVIADRSKYQDDWQFQMRDYAATILAFWQIYVDPPQVSGGNKITF